MLYWSKLRYAGHKRGCEKMLRLRTYKNSDARKIVSWLTEEEAFQKWAAGRLHWPLSEEQFQHFAAAQLEEERTYLVTALDERGEPVGFLCMTKADYEKNSIHFCYIIVSSRSRGKGYGTQMLQLAVRYAAELLQMQRITLRVFENNQAARRCYQKVGFREEAYYPMAMEYKGARWPAYDIVYQVP